MNKDLFGSSGKNSAKKVSIGSSSLPRPRVDTRNEAGGTAYAFEPKHALAQFVVTGCLNNTFYFNATNQLEETLRLCREVADAEYVAKLAVYAREQGFMKDTPALLCAWLSTVSPEMAEKVFDRVVDNGKMVRNYVQVMTSGALGRQGLGSLAKRLVQKWFAARTDDEVFRQSIGNKPSMADVLRLSHPRPTTKSREALYSYLLGTKEDAYNVFVWRVKHEPKGKATERLAELLSDVRGLPARKAAKLAESLISESKGQIFLAKASSRDEADALKRKAKAAGLGCDVRLHFKMIQGWAEYRKALPLLVREYEGFKASCAEGEKGVEPPDVPFQMLTSCELSEADWAEIARNAQWQMTRQNLNTFQRHKVFDDEAMVRMVADRLRDPEQVAKARCFPYQLLAAWKNARDIPTQVMNALQDAMEVAVANIPKVDGKVFVFPDVSGSMASPVTGYREGSTTKVQCVDVAALVAAAFLRANEDAEVIPFNNDIQQIRLNPRDSVMTNAEKLGRAGGGTRCASPLAYLNRKGFASDGGVLCVYVSDYESWMDVNHRCYAETMVQWEEFKRRNPRARMVCIDAQPSGSTQAPNRADILNVGGFSDQVFKIAARFAADEMDAAWVEEIEQLDLDEAPRPRRKAKRKQEPRGRVDDAHEDDKDEDEYEDE